MTPQGLLKGCSFVASAQPRCSHLSPPADMLKDVIQEYDEYFPEIIERASYALEKVKWQPWGMGAVAKPLNQTKVYTSLLEALHRLTQPHHCAVGQTVT